MMRTALMAMLGVLMLTLPALADCVGPDGNAYPTGTRVGSLVCQADGTWR